MHNFHWNVLYRCYTRSLFRPVWGWWPVGFLRVRVDMPLTSLQQRVVLRWFGVSLTRWLAVAQLVLHVPLSCTHMIHCDTSETCWLGCIRLQFRSTSTFLHCSSAAQRLVSQTTLSDSHIMCCFCVLWYCRCCRFLEQPLHVKSAPTLLTPPWELYFMYFLRLRRHKWSEKNSHMTSFWFVERFESYLLVGWLHLSSIVVHCVYVIVPCYCVPHFVVWVHELFIS